MANKDLVFCHRTKKNTFWIYFLVLALLPISSISAISQDYVQEKSLTVKLENKTVKEVLDDIEKNSSFIFMYSKELLNVLDKVVTIQVENEDIASIMAVLAKETNINYEIKGKQIILSKASEQQKRQQGININGSVWDEQGNPLPGVNVTVKSTTIGTTTDVNGNYFLEVPSKNSVLVFSYIGFKSKEIQVGNQININVNLSEESNSLEEVVVVGYGSQKKASVVGAITSVEPAQLQQGTNRAVSNNLAGQLAGVIAVQRNGAPGSDGSDFWIRGISSFQSTGTSPLVLVDGIERTLDDLSAAEIESFSVLKDAAASAVYGVRGANGVIIVKTKRGELGKPKVDVHFEQGFTSPTKLPDYIGSADYLTLMNELYLDAGNPNPIYTEEMINGYRNHTDADLYPDVNWLDAVSKDMASNTRGDITVTGGSDILRYALVASYYGERGILESDKTKEWDSSTRLNKYNIRSNVDINLTKTTVLGVSIGGYLQEMNRPDASDSDIWSYAFQTPPYVHPTQYSDGSNVRVLNRQNPWARLTQHGYQTSSSSKIESTFSLEQDLKFITPGLKIKGIFSFDRYSNSWVTRSGTPTYYTPTTQRDENGELVLSVGTDGQEFLDNSNDASWGNKATYLEGNLTYNRTFNEKHAVSAMLLYNQRDYSDGSVVPYRRMGYAGRASYTFDNRYIAEFNFGYNGSENFSAGNRFGFFPSVAVGYLLSEEKFMEKYKNTFSKIKFRASWGLTGNDQLSGRRFAFLSTIDTDGSYRWGINNDFNRSSRFEGEIGVTDLTWETVEKLNVGMELGLFNVLDLQVDWFKEQRRDIFMQRSNVPTAAGFRKTPWANFGKVNNGGVDLSLVYNQSINKDLNIGFRGTFTYAHNEIIEQDEPMGRIGTNRQRTGHSVNELFGLVAERLFTEDDFVTNEEGELVLKEGIPAHTFNTVRPGDIKYLDLNGDNAVNSMDETALGGTNNPEIVYGFGATSRYKNVDFNIFFQGNGRTYRFIGGVANYFLPGTAMGSMGNIFSNYNDRWTAENPSQDVFYPRLTWGTNTNNSQNSTWWLRNMSMLRMKDVEIGYTFPKRWINQIGLSNFRIYAKGSNLFTFSAFDLWDPELDTNNGAKYPLMKSFSFGFNIDF